MSDIRRHWGTPSFRIATPRIPTVPYSAQRGITANGPYKNRDRDFFGTPPCSHPTSNYNSLMANDPPVKRHLNSGSEPCDLNFSSYRKGVHLDKFEAHLDALRAAHGLSSAYQDVLDRSEIFARHFGAKLKADALEETIRRAFTRESPQLEDPDNAEVGDLYLSWVDVVRKVDPKEIQRNADGTYQCVIQGLMVMLSESDFAALQTGLLQKLAIPWPHQDDVQVELDTVASIVADLTGWDQIALQSKGKLELLL